MAEHALWILLCQRYYHITNHCNKQWIPIRFSYLTSGDNFMMWGEDGTVDTQYPSKILNGFCGVHNCVAWKNLQIFFLLDQLEEGEHWKFLVFQYGNWSSLLSPQERIPQEQHLSQSERQNNDFSNRQSTLHLFLADVGWCYTNHFHLALGAKWWAQISCRIIFWYKALKISGCYCKKSGATSFLVCVQLQHLWQPIHAEFGIAELFNKCHYAASTNG